MTTTSATYHDVEPYAVEGNGMASARCLTHLTATTEQWPTMSGAAHGFRCDAGRNLRFITEFSGEDLDLIPVMRDLSGLAKTIRSDAEGHAYMQDHGHTSAWLWHAGGHIEALTIALAGSTGFDGDDYATESWTVIGEDGRVILSVPVRIDGRA